MWLIRASNNRLSPFPFSACASWHSRQLTKSLSVVTSHHVHCHVSWHAIVRGQLRSIHGLTAVQVQARCRAHQIAGHGTMNFGARPRGKLHCKHDTARQTTNDRPPILLQFVCQI